MPREEGNTCEGAGDVVQYTAALNTVRYVISATGNTLSKIRRMKMSRYIDKINLSGRTWSCSCCKIVREARFMRNRKYCENCGPYIKDIRLSMQNKMYAKIRKVQRAQRLRQ
jgi:hypothetical protein